MRMRWQDGRRAWMWLAWCQILLAKVYVDLVVGNGGWLTWTPMLESSQEMSVRKLNVGSQLAVLGWGLAQEVLTGRARDDVVLPVQARRRRT